MKRFRTCSLDQPYLLPPSLDDWLPEGHLARFVARVVDELDLSAIVSKYARRDGRGKAAYHPVLLVRLLVYGYAVGRRSSRRIERATYDEVPFRYLAAGQHPDHDTIAAFRQAHLEELAQLFVQVLALCQTAGLIKLGQIAIDGTKIAANASTRRSSCYSKLTEREQQFAAEVDKLLAVAQAVDASEDRQYGHGRGDELPAELATAEKQLARIRAAKQELEREARERAEQAKQEKKAQCGKPRDETQRKRWQRARKATPGAKSQGNLTDPESRVMKDGASKRFLQGYNAQIAVDGAKQVIVAHAVTQQENDRRQLAPMIELVEHNLQAKPELVTADAGYWNQETVVAQQQTGYDVLVPPNGFSIWKRTGQLPANGARGVVADKMRERLVSDAGRQQYNRRCGIVEPVFGLIKEQRGCRRFLLRGLKKVAAEWSLLCAVTNLWRLYRYAPQAVGA
jgi:transposase